MSEKLKNNCQNPYNICYDNYLDTTACTECTGLIPISVHSLDEWENYKDVFNFLPASPAKSENDFTDIPHQTDT